MATIFRITLFLNTFNGSEQLVETIPKVSHSSENVHHLIKNMSVHNYTICLWMRELKEDLHDSQKSCMLKCQGELSCNWSILIAFQWCDYFAICFSRVWYVKRWPYQAFNHGYQNVACQSSRRSILFCVYGNIYRTKTATMFAQLLPALFRGNSKDEWPSWCHNMSWVSKRESSPWRKTQRSAQQLSHQQLTRCVGHKGVQLYWSQMRKLQQTKSRKFLLFSVLLVLVWRVYYRPQYYPSK